MNKTPCSSPDNCRGEIRALAAENAFNDMVVLLKKAELDCRLALESVRSVGAAEIFEVSRSTHEKIAAERDALGADRDKFLREAQAAQREVEVLRAIVRDLEQQREKLMWWRHETLNGEP